MRVLGGGGGFKSCQTSLTPSLLLKCLYQTRWLGSDVYVCWGYWFYPCFCHFFDYIVELFKQCGIFKRGTKSEIWPDKRGSFWWEWTYKGGGRLLYIKIFSRPKVYNLTFLPPFLIMQSYTSNEFIWSCQRCTRYHADAEKVVSNNKTWYI